MLLSRLTGDMLIGIEYAEAVESSVNEFNSLSREDQFKYEVSVLCYRYALAGLTCNKKPIPLPFRIKIDGCVAKIVIPAYLEIDWKRDMPGDVMKFLQKRGAPFSSVRLERLSDQERITGYGKEDDRLKKRCAELIRVYLNDTRRNKRNQNWIYDTLCQEFTITKAEHMEDRRKVCRRRLKRLGIKIPKRSSKITTA